MQMALYRPPPQRRWRVTSETGRDLGVFVGASPADAVTRMTTLGPRGRGQQTPYWRWGQTFGLQYGGGSGFTRVSQHAREFPLGFFDAAVGSAGGAPATPAEVVGTVSLLTPGLYGGAGSLNAITATLIAAIDGNPPRTAILGSPPVADAAALIARINLIIAPFGVASIQPLTNFLVITSTATGSGASVLLSGTSLPLLGLIGLPVFGSDPVTPVGVVNVISHPQLATFRGERLVIPESIALNFSLIDIKVGNKSQLVNSTALPAVIFVEGGVGMRLALDTATTAMDVALQIENNAPTPLPFMGALFGTTFMR
jgi:hypothetical protein